MKFRVEVVVEDGEEMQRIVAMERQCKATDKPNMWPWLDDIGWEEFTWKDSKAIDRD